MLQLTKGIRVLWITIGTNIILSIFKIIAGIIGQSTVIIADGIHSLSDVITSFFAMIGIKVAAKKADANHPYGHEKFEPIFANLVCVFLIITGLGLGYNNIIKIFNNNVATPGNIALLAAIVSILIKEGMFWYTIKAAKKLKSIAMEVDAWHHRSDAISSVVALAGVYGAKMGYPFLDPIAGIIISFLIIKIGLEFYLKAINELVDTSINSSVLKQIKKIVISTEGVQGIKEIKSRIFGNRFYVDINILVDGDLSLRNAHNIAVLVHDRVEQEIEECKHCLVHVDPV